MHRPKAKAYHRNENAQKTLAVVECHSNKPHNSWMVVVLLIEIELERSGQLLDALYAFSIKDDHTRGCPTRILELPYWNIPPKYWGAILRTKIPQGLSGISMVCHYYLFLSLFTSLPRIMLILGGPDGISDSVRETMRKVLDA